MRKERKTYERCFTKKFGSSNQISNRHMEVSVTRAPIRDTSEGMGCKDIFGHRIDQTYTMFVYGNQKVLRITCVTVLL